MKYSERLTPILGTLHTQLQDLYRQRQSVEEGIESISDMLLSVDFVEQPEDYEYLKFARDSRVRTRELIDQMIKDQQDSILKIQRMQKQLALTEGTV